MSSYRKTMAEALQEVSDKNKLKVLARKIKKYKDKVFKKTMSTIPSPLFADNELDEGRMKDIFTADQEGKSAEEIAKLMKLPLKTVKGILGEGIKPYVSMQRSQATGKMNYVVLDKDEKEAFRSTDQRVATDYWKKNYDKLKEEVIVEFSDSMLDKLKKEYEPLKNKTISVDQANKLRKIFSMIPDRALDALRKKKIPFLSGLALSRMVQKGMPVREELELDEASSAEIMKKAKEFGVTVKMTPKGIDVSAFKSQDGMDKFMKFIASKDKNMINLAKVGMKRNFEELEETPQGYALVQKAKEIAKKMANNYSGAVKEIEKLQKGLSDNSSVQAALLKANESLEEKKSAFRISYSKDGQHAGFEDADTLQQIQRAAANLRMKGFTIDKMGRNTSPVKEDNEKEEPKQDTSKETDTDKIKLAKEKDTDALEKQLIAAQGQINILKQKLENEKNKAIKPEPNPETGEVPLTVGVAYKHFKDKKEKEEVKKEDVSEKVMSDKEKRIQRAKDMIKYYDAQKKAALKGKNKDLAKKMLKNDIEETVSIKAYKNAVDPSKKGLMISKSGGMSGTIMIKDKKELKDLETKLAQAKRLYNIKEMKKDDAYAIGMAQAKKSMNDEPPLDKKTITKGHEIAKKILKKENTSAFNPTVHNKTLGVTSKDLDRAFSKLSQKAQSHVNDLLRTGMGTRDAIKKAKEKFKENNINEGRRLYVESLAGLKKKSEKSGMPYSILKKVFDRGMAAWKSGHRPGASQQQWAYARVNSFITKSSGTWGGADKDLAKQVRGK